MKILTFITILFCLFSCNNDGSNSKSKITKSDSFKEDTLTLNDIYNYQFIINDSIDTNKFEYVFVNPLIDDTIMHLYYENGIAVDYVEPYNKLIFGRVNYPDGRVIMYAHTPPNHTLETYVFSKNLITGKMINDTIFGEVIEFYLNPDDEVKLICYGLNNKDIAIFKDSYLLYFKETEYNKPYPFLISENYRKRNGQVDGYKTEKIILED